MQKLESLFKEVKPQQSINTTNTLQHQILGTETKYINEANIENLEEYLQTL